MKQKGFSPILVVLIFAAIFVVAGAGYWYSAENKKVAQENLGQVVPKEAKKEVVENKPEEKVIKEVGHVRYYQPYFSLGVSLSEPDPSILEKQDVTANGYITLRGKMPFLYPISIRATCLESEDHKSKDYLLYDESVSGSGFAVTIPLEFGLGKYEITLFAPHRNEPGGDVEMVKAISFDLINEDFKKEVIEKIDMSGWKNYRNDNLGFIFKYPPQMRFEETWVNNYDKTTTRLQFYITFFNKNSADMPTAFMFSVFDNNKGLTLNDWVGKKSFNNNTFEMVDLGSYVATKYTKNEMNYGALIYYTEHDNKIIRISSVFNTMEIKNIASSLIFNN
jgi:hypothetical protein